MMPMDSASRRFRCWESTWRVWELATTMSASGGERHGIQGAARDEERIAEIRLAVGEGLTARGEHLAARGGQHCMPGGGVPLHRGSEARIEVRLTSGNQAELEGRADGDPIVDRVVA